MPLPIGGTIHIVTGIPFNGVTFNGDSLYGVTRSNYAKPNKN